MEVVATFATGSTLVGHVNVHVSLSLSNENKSWELIIRITAIELTGHIRIKLLEEKHFVIKVCLTFYLLASKHYKYCFKAIILVKQNLSSKNGFKYKRFFT